MIAPFRRRDTATYALITGAMVAVTVLFCSVGRMGLGWQTAGWTVAATVVAMLVPVAIGWRLPPDLPLHPLPADAARQALAPPPSSIARLRVAMPPEPLGSYRIDLYLDGLRIGQARSGAVVVIPISLGGHGLTMQVWLRRLRRTELINALPGTDTDLLIRVSGGKSTQYSVARQDLAVSLADRRIAVFGPIEPGHQSTGL